MDIQALKEKLKSEGFPIVYEWKDEAGKTYENHMHQDKVSMYVVSGSITFDFYGEKKLVQPGERLDVPPKTEHSAVVGEEGCEYVVGQITEDDDVSN